jgi:hyperosmotically inducible protein
MKFPRLHITAFTAAVILSALTFPLTTIAQSSAMPDNSKQNQTQNQTGTADNQSNAKSDRDTTAKVRKAIIADKNLSTYGHNVKIITSNGAVTLKGPVKSDAEKQQVASDAAGAVSADKITNELTVKP